MSCQFQLGQTVNISGNIEPVLGLQELAPNRVQKMFSLSFSAGYTEGWERWFWGTHGTLPQATLVCFRDPTRRFHEGAGTGTGSAPARL